MPLLTQPHTTRRSTAGRAGHFHLLPVETDHALNHGVASRPVSEFERALIRERQREGIAIAKSKGVYRGRNLHLTTVQVKELQGRVAAGEKKAALARELGISKETLYQYVRARGVRDRCRQGNHL